VIYIRQSNSVPSTRYNTLGTSFCTQYIHAASLPSAKAASLPSVKGKAHGKARRRLACHYRCAKKAKRLARTLGKDTSCHVFLLLSEGCLYTSQFSLRCSFCDIRQSNYVPSTRYNTLVTRFCAQYMYTFSGSEILRRVIYSYNALNRTAIT
jgi:hypothetical protein